MPRERHPHAYARAGGKAVAAAIQKANQQPTRLVRFTQYGCEDLRHAHVVATYQGRQLLGDVKHQEYRDGPISGHMLYVHHFNGEPWPVYPISAAAVRVLNREFTED